MYSGKRISSRLASKAVKAPQSVPPPAPPITVDEDEDVEVYEDYDELDEEEEYDSEAEAAAEAMAQQMTDELAAEIGKVYAFKSDGTADPIAPVIRHLLSLAAAEPRLQSALTDTKLPEAASSSILDLLSAYLTTGHLNPSHTLALSRSLLNLLNAPLMDDLEPTSVIGKRKRDQQAQHAPLPAPTPPPSISPSSIHIEARIRAAVEAVSLELASHNFDGSLLSIRIKPQLGQIYHFTTTYADAADSSSSYILREISKLIKDTELLDRSQLAYPPVVDKDTSTAIFPCYRHPCSKLFASSSTLAAHSQTHNSGAGKAGKTPTPTAGITLQYQCDACKAVFPGRDAARRHAESSGPACADASVNVIEHKSGSGLIPSATVIAREGGGGFQEGELDPKILARAQEAVAKLQIPLREHVVARKNSKAANKNNGQAEEAAVVVEFDELGMRKTPASVSATPAPTVPPVPVADHSTPSAGSSNQAIAAEDSAVPPPPPPSEAPLSSVPNPSPTPNPSPAINLAPDEQAAPSSQTLASSVSSPQPQPQSTSQPPDPDPSHPTIPPDPANEHANLELEMLKMMEEAQAEAEAEVMMDMSDVDVDIDIDDEDEEIDIVGVDGDGDEDGLDEPEGDEGIGVGGHAGGVEMEMEMEGVEAG